MKFREWIGRDFDVLISDNSDTGMVGYYRHEDDPIYEGQLAGLIV